MCMRRRLATYSSNLAASSSVQSALAAHLWNRMRMRRNLRPKQPG